MQFAVFVFITIFMISCSTPYGEAGLGGAREQQLTEDTFSIRTAINGFSPPGSIKPLMLRRAREIGKTHGYDSFVIEAVHLHYDVPGSGYLAQSRVRFSAQPFSPDAGRTYAVNGADLYRSSLDSSDAQRFAKLKGSWPHGEDVSVLQFVPVFLDAMSTTSFGRDSTSFLEPGVQKFFVHFWLTRRGFFSDAQHGFVLLERQFEASKSYVVTGSYQDGAIELWLEDEATKTPIGQRQLVRLTAR